MCVPRSIKEHRLAVELLLRGYANTWCGCVDGANMLYKGWMDGNLLNGENDRKKALPILNQYGITVKQPLGTVANIFKTVISSVPKAGLLASLVNIPENVGGKDLGEIVNAPALLTDEQIIALDAYLRNPTTDNLKVVQQINNGPRSTGINSNFQDQNFQQNKMVDLLKRWLFVLISALLGVFGIVYSASAKSSTDKKKRKPFLYLGIAASTVAAFLAFKKIRTNQ